MWSAWTCVSDGDDRRADRGRRLDIPVHEICMRVDDGELVL
jgi:hypothetical protein